MKRFGKILREVREALDMTQGQMADALEISRGYVSMIESQESPRASWDVILRFCTYADISHNQIILEMMEPEEMSEESQALVEALRQSLESQITTS